MECNDAPTFLHPKTYSVGGPKIPDHGLISFGWCVLIVSVSLACKQHRHTATGKHVSCIDIKSFQFIVRSSYGLEHEQMFYSDVELVSLFAYLFRPYQPHGYL